MHLREIVINGFKSFADRTVIRLDPGVTCIVGPNGCGKSNIVDAIRWVLGEQSAKALRGGRMHDVIFQGTDERKPLPSCEVRLLFTDCEAELGTQFNEVEITRKVDREGGGDYYLNGKRCRLKDIQHLFMNTGVGQASYSFMMQGQIDQILSSNPQERRSLFEEAAGITRYKAQRKEALNKLNLVEQNLARVTDIIEEVGRQIRSLKRQASKALRHQRLKHRLTHLDLALNAQNYAQHKGILETVEVNINSLQEEVFSGEAALKTGDSLLAKLREQRGESNARVQQTLQAVFELRSEKEKAHKQAQLAQTRRKDLGERIKSIRKEAKALLAKQKALSHKAQDAIRDQEKAKAVVAASDVAFREKNDGLQAVLTQLSETMQGLQTKRQEALLKEGGLSRLRSQCTSFEVDLKSFQAKRAAYADALCQTQEQRNKLEENLEAITAMQQSQNKARDKAETLLHQAQELEKALTQTFRNHQIEIQEIDRELARENAQLSTLADLQARFEGFSEGGRAILQGKLADLLPHKQLNPLSSLIEFEDEAWSTAVETLLGAAIEAIALEQRDALSAIATALDREKLGRACLQFPLPGHTPTPNSPSHGLIPFAHVVKAKEPGLAEPLMSFFQQCYLCESLEDFLTFWEEHPDFSFNRVATAKGELIDGRGLAFVGRTQQKARQSNLIQREAGIKTLRKSIREKKQKLSQLREQAMSLQEALDQASQDLESKRQHSVELGQTLSSLQSEHRSAAQALQDNKATTEKQQQQLNSLKQTQLDLETRLKVAKSSLSSAEKALQDNKAAITLTEITINQLRTEADAHRDGLTEVRLDLSEKQQKLEWLNRSLTETTTQQGELEKRALQYNQEADTFMEQSGGLEIEERQNLERATEIEEALKHTTENLKQNQQALSQIEQEMLAQEQSLDVMRPALREKANALSAQKVKLAEERSQTHFIVEKVRTEYEREVAQIDGLMELWHAKATITTKASLNDLEEAEDLTLGTRKEQDNPTEDDLAKLNQTDWVSVKVEIRELRDRIESLGTVNLMAIEAYAELKERFDFLTTQSEDLWQSKDELLQAIERINKISQKMFEETFEQIRKNFMLTFQKLFDGGEGNLKLMEAEAVLDSGIEIIVRPPGTKLRTLALLSGGQRTMTAVALLFAIYKVKPSPFAVLDELDAPLDDANIERFTSMIHEFIQYSQFLIITHNKRTLVAADSIYGVTMQERGITQLISMQIKPTSKQ